MAGTGDVLGIGVSALLAFQQELSTTGHNIANVNTDGYSRQRVNLTAATPQSSTGGFVGQGVQVSSITRSYSDFLTSQVRTVTTAFNSLDTFNGLASQVDNTLADSSAGLMPTLQNFFNSLQDLSNDPTSGAARQVVLSDANALTNRFQYLYQQTGNLRQGVNTDITNIVSNINSLAQSIADTNQQIIVAQSAAQGQAPNDLLDKRDALLNQLAQQVGVTAIPQQNGTLSVFIGNGQALVVGNQARALQVTGSNTDPTSAEVAFAPPYSSSAISQFISGGKLGGDLEFRSQVLDQVQNSLGRLAIGLAGTFNAQHELGQDANGDLGGAFFNVPTPAVLPDKNNTTDNNPSVSITDPGALTTADYRLQFDGTNGWTLTNLTSNTTVPMSGAGTDANPFVADGLSISVQGVGAGAGDNYTYLIEPTRNGARDISVAITDPSKIAAATPLRATAGTANTGSGQISLNSLTNTNAVPLSSHGGPITLTFDSATAAGTPATAASNAVTFSGAKASETIDFSGITLANVDNGDYLTIGGNKFVVDNTGTPPADNYTTRTFYVDTSAVASNNDLAQAFADKIDAVDASASNTATANSLDPTTRTGATLTLTSAYASSTSTPLAVTGNAFNTSGSGETAAVSLTAGSGPAAGDVITLNGQDYVFNFLGSGVTASAAQTEVTIGATADASAANFAAAVDPQANISASATGNVATVTADTAGAAGTALVTDTNPTADTGISESVTPGADATGQLPGFTVSGGPGGTLAYDPSTEDGGKTFTLGSPYDGISFTISGDPTNGDTFVINDNTNGIGDNTNALALTALQGNTTLGKGTLTYEQAYNQVVASVGTQTQQSKTNSDAQSALLTQAQNSRDSLSAVNLDEEASNMLRFQQAYQAAAQMINTANLMFNTLLGVVSK